eukprot:TRINITY_DN6606_c0_g1_i1.p1 TRINITY_DN6606_c0_g1~~TRINITY_DN6606_c0_g1_i1.p1  ORF type:complete len:162 (-),score=20.22 TRINITY_DN6606_c0_g1_i1:413-838(-)
MAWETWQNGGVANNLPSSCYPQFSHTIASVTFGATTWTVSKDHAKWGVTLDIEPCPCDSTHSSRKLLHEHGALARTANGVPSVCIGDMNRQYSQAKRGGGTLCFLGNTALVASFANSIATVECGQGLPPAAPSSYVTTTKA